MSTFTIEHTVTRATIDEQRVGGQALLVAEARAMNPAADKHNRSDTKFSGGFESTLLDQWEEISISVIRIKHGIRDELEAGSLSRHMDFKQFFQSAANGQLMTLDATDIGGVDAQMYVKLISASNELVRIKTKQLFNAKFRLQVMGYA